MCDKGGRGNDSVPMKRRATRARVSRPYLLRSFIQKLLLFCTRPCGFLPSLVSISLFTVQKYLRDYRQSLSHQLVLVLEYVNAILKKTESLRVEE